MFYKEMVSLKRLLAVVLCLLMTFAMVACGQEAAPKTETTTAPASPTTLATTLEYIEQHTTVTENEDGSTTYTLTTGTENPAIPSFETVSPTKTKPVSTTIRPRPTTTTKKRTTTTNTRKTEIVTENKKTTTTTQKPAPIPTIPTTTTTTTVAPKPGVTTTTTTKKSSVYGYVANQDHTPLPVEQRYYYTLLSDEWKTCYRQIDEAVRYLDASVTFNLNITENRKHLIYFIYMFDNPELFYLASTMTITSSGDGTSGIKFAYAVGNKDGEYCRYGSSTPEVTDALREKIRAKQAKFDDAVYAFTSTIPAAAPAVVKERLIYDKILKSCEYNLSAAYGHADAIGGLWDGMANDNWTAYGIMINHTGVCESYAEAFQTLCNAVGIQCTGIVGTAGGGHKWSAVQIDGEWYMCDITFDDPIGSAPDDAFHTYFNLTSNRFKELQHVWADSNWEDYFSQLKFPNCTGTKYNWENYVTLYGE